MELAVTQKDYNIVVMTAKNCVNINLSYIYHPIYTSYIKVDILAVTKHMRRLLQDSTGPNSTMT